jgi:hypothetical protein
VSSSSPSLCTFPATHAVSSRDFAQDCLVLLTQDLGFPEFTRFVKPDYSGRLLVAQQPHALPLSYRGIQELQYKEIDSVSTSRKNNPQPPPICPSISPSSFALISSPTPRLPPITTLPPPPTSPSCDIADRQPPRRSPPGCDSSPR